MWYYDKNITNHPTKVESLTTEFHAYSVNRSIKFIGRMNNKFNAVSPSVSAQILSSILLMLMLVLIPFGLSYGLMFNLQIGKTKVFLRAGQMAELDARRTEVLSYSASKIQRKVRSFLARRNFIQLRMSSVQLQAMCRGKFSSIYVANSITFQYLIFLWR